MRTLREVCCQKEIRLMSVARTATLPLFAKYVWSQLPIRKLVVGEEIIDDIVILAVQHFPVSEMSQVEPKSPEEASLLRELCKIIDMNLVFIYGDINHEAYWRLGLEAMIGHVVYLVQYWWRRSKRNRGNLILWRRKWMADEDA